MKLLEQTLSPKYLISIQSRRIVTMQQAAREPAARRRQAEALGLRCVILDSDSYTHRSSYQAGAQISVSAGEHAASCARLAHCGSKCRYRMQAHSPGLELLAVGMGGGVSGMDAHTLCEDNPPQESIRGRVTDHVMEVFPAYLP